MSFYFFLYNANSEPKTGYKSLSDPYYDDESPKKQVLLAQNLKTGDLVEIPLDIIVGNPVYTEKTPGHYAFSNILNNIGE